MIVTIHQPNFMPYLGFFDKAACADTLILLDTVQYTKNGLQNRNRIKTAQGEMWLTVPILTKNSFGISTKDALIDNKKDWRSQHVKSISLSYKKAKHFAEFEGYLRGLYGRDWEHLAELSTEFITYVIKLLPKEVKVIRSSELDNAGSRSDLLLHLCKQVGATTYLSGKSGRDYLDTSVFEKNNMKLEFHSFKGAVYEQLWGEFIPDLSITDYLLNCGSGNFGKLMEKKSK